MIKIVVFVPSGHVEPVKAALFAAGAGQIGDYEHCCWQVEGSGQFRPMAAADPYLGSAGVTETVRETKIELVCKNECATAAVQAMLTAHPYEEPAYELLPMLSLSEL